ncbi:MAG TPA: leucine-rich repeat domain-containing protein [Verrucomicrobiae bacterium]
MKAKRTPIQIWLLCAGMLPAVAQGQFTFTTNNGAITITGYTGFGGDVVIPDSTNGYPIVSIGDSAFDFSRNLTSVTIPNGVTSIGDAFDWCTSLNSVAIGSGVTNIGSTYVIVDVGSGVAHTNISSAFYGCTNLTAINVNDQNLFYSSTNGVLFDKNKTTLVEYPGGLGSGSYSIPDGVVNIVNDAFRNCVSLTNIVIPEGVTSIGDAAFSGTGLTSVIIPNSVTGIGEGAFSCFYLTHVTIGSGLASIGDSVFDGCASLTSITIPNNITSIGPSAFGSSGLTSITIPSSVTNIGDNAFVVCYNLASATIPGSVISIGGNAFGSCRSLTSVTIFNGLISIGGDAFSASGLTSVTIPMSVTNIGPEAFAWCPNLTMINVDAQNSFYSSPGGVLFDKSLTKLIQYPSGLNGGYTISNGVTSIAVEAFSTSGLTSVTIPNSVTNIGHDAFMDTPLTSVTIPGSVSIIEDGTFANCTSLTNLTIGNGVTSIGISAFALCSELTKVVIPNSVIIIMDYAFQECDGLNSVIIGNSVANIGDFSFGYCPNLTSAYFLGNFPAVAGAAFVDDDNVTVYYMPGVTGWDGTGAVLWNPQAQTGDASFGVKANQFGFNITGTANIPILVEACASLGDAWVPLQTLSLTNGSVYFSDPQWANYPSRFYRLSSP